MCGIVSMISKTPHGFTWKEKGIFEQMLFVNTLRGIDSTGVFGVNKYGNLKMIKAAKPAVDFVRTKTVKDFLAKITTDFRIVVGHNRATTKGATSDENAHPFIEDHTCLVHNGTLHTHRHLKNVDVDSHAICHAINEKDYKEVIPELNGAYALIWYDAKEKKLHISRNTERPLWIVQTDTTDFIASEPAMLIWILNRNGITNVKTEYFVENQVYTYKVDDLKNGFNNIKLPEKKLPHYSNEYSTHYLNSRESQKQQTTYFYKDYKFNQEVIFYHEKNTYQGDKIIFSGFLTGNGNQLATLTCKIEDAEHFLAEDFISAKIIGSSTKDGITKLILGHPKQIKTYTSITNIIITEQELMEHGGVCDSCGTWADLDTEPFWIRYKGGSIKSLKCTKCIDADEHLTKLKEQHNAT